MKKLVIFADYGMDDAIATLHIFKYNKWDSIDIVPIGGNVTAAHSLINAQTLLYHYNQEGGDISNITLVDTRGIAQPSHELIDIHGGDGMGSILMGAETNIKPVEFWQWLSGVKNQDCEILSLGPCTVPLIAAKNGLIFPCVQMGGCVDVAPNFGEYEFNQALDAEAFKAFLALINPVVVTLDTARHKALDFKDFTPADTSLLSILTGRLTMMTLKRHSHYVAIYDYAAARYLTHTKEFKLISVTDPHGLKYSMAVVG